MEKSVENESHRRRWLLAAGVVIVLAVAAFIALMSTHAGVQRSNGQPVAFAHAPRVEVIHPTRGLIERTVGEACNAYAFDTADLKAEVSGYLKKQPVDIGAQVKAGDLLDQIDVPELVEEKKQQEANVTQAEANVELAKAKKLSADADLHAARATVKQAEANARTAKAMLALRTQQLTRYQNLSAQNAIDRELVDEKQEQKNAAQANVYSTTAAISAAEAQEEAARAKVAQAVAAIATSKTQVDVARAALGKAKQLVTFSILRAPYDGVITQRNFNVGDFIRAATEGGSQVPLLTIQKVDVMRVVVPIPDRDSPYAHKGEPTVVRFDALPGRTYRFPVARVAKSEDVETKTMRLEIDLPNATGTILQAALWGRIVDPALPLPAGWNRVFLAGLDDSRAGVALLREWFDPEEHHLAKILQGMYGLATIILQKDAHALTVPSSCLVGGEQKGEADLFLVENGKLRKVHVPVGIDNGVRVQILETLETRKILNEHSDIVLNPSGDMIDGESVTPVPAVSNR